jgi:sugar diacid utilization regulator
VLLSGVWVCAVLAGSELLGGIALSGRPDLPDADRRVFERSAAVTALLLLLRRTVAEAENKVRGELITDVLDGRDAAGLLARARRVGVELSDPHVVLVADGNLSGATHYASVHRGLAGSRGRDVVLALPSVSTHVAREVAKALDATVGACGPVAGPVAIAAAYEEARRCLKALRQLGRDKDAATMDDLGFVGVLLGDRADVSGYVRSVLGPVLDYDSERGTELVHTLEVYFRCGANLSRAKAELHLHVNTVTQRLDRVSSLLGDWQSPERVLEVQLALRLLRLQG